MLSFDFPVTVGLITPPLWSYTSPFLSAQIRTLSGDAPTGCGQDVEVENGVRVSSTVAVAEVPGELQAKRCFDGLLGVGVVREAPSRLSNLG